MRAQTLAAAFTIFGATVAQGVLQPVKKLCQIVGDYNANCRLCPSVDAEICPVVVILPLHNSYTFSCRDEGALVADSK